MSQFLRERYVRSLRRYDSSGFSLLELAIVMVVISLLLVAFLPSLNSQYEQQRVVTTQRAMDEAKEAIAGFVMQNGRLPCPADPVGNQGTEQLAGNACANAEGALPWATLGVKQLDAWGRRYTYRVAPAFADTIAAGTPGCAGVAPALSSIAMCATGNITVNDRSGGGAIALATGVPAAIVSHGQNGYGAYTASGTQIPTAGGTADEMENANGDAVFVSHPRDNSSYDDLVVWLPKELIVSRLVTAGRLPS
ncbi:prepilin-type N-terminal cleavage/methylation domain-containing protein [Chitinivorax sp. PXF-14]|uniref:type II secretion system protein n=1 Tax=Chitinivorax sp. PXF-14 TaxID=3230488 RepID=UPI003466499C